MSKTTLSGVVRKRFSDSPVASSATLDASKRISPLFLILALLFCIFLTAANLFAIKPFRVGPVAFTGAIILFPVSYIINDVVSEVWGYRRARMLIWLAFGFNLLFVLFGWLVDVLPGAADWQQSPAAEGFHAVFGLAPRVVAASLLAFLVGSNVNAIVMSRMKVATKGKWFAARAIVSTIFGESLDSLIFFPVALGGAVLPWSAMPRFVLWQVTIKTVYELVILPVTYRISRAVKRHEGVDVYDTKQGEPDAGLAPHPDVQ